MPQILRSSGLEIVHANDMRAVVYEAVAQVRTDESRAAGHERNLLVPTLHLTLLHICSAGSCRCRLFDMLLELGRAMSGGMRSQYPVARGATDRGRIHLR